MTHEHLSSDHVLVAIVCQVIYVHAVMLNYRMGQTVHLNPV